MSSAIGTRVLTELNSACKSQGSAAMAAAWRSASWASSRAPARQRWCKWPPGEACLCPATGPQCCRTKSSPSEQACKTVVLLTAAHWPQIHEDEQQQQRLDAIEHLLQALSSFDTCGKIRSGSHGCRGSHALCSKQTCLSTLLFLCRLTSSLVRSSGLGLQTSESELYYE